MRSVKRTVLFAVILLACAGVYAALRNLPVISGCAFYGECPDQSEAARTKQIEPSRSERVSAAAESDAP
jgi:hypothetical protein